MNHSGYSSKVGREEDDDDDIDTVLFVDNLDGKVTLEMIHKLFVQAGPIKKISSLQGPNGQSHKGNCFIHFEQKTSVLDAIDLMEGTNFFGRKIKLYSLSGHQKIDDHVPVTFPPFVPAYHQDPMPDFIPLERTRSSQQKVDHHRYRRSRNGWVDSSQSENMTIDIDLTLEDQK